MGELRSVMSRTAMWRQFFSAIGLGPWRLERLPSMAPGTDDPDMFDVLRPYQRVVEIGRFFVGERFEIELLVGVKVLWSGLAAKTAPASRKSMTWLLSRTVPDRYLPEGK